LLADIGGVLGLILGLNIFDMIVYLFLIVQKLHNKFLHICSERILQLRFRQSDPSTESNLITEVNPLRHETANNAEKPLIIFKLTL